MYSSNHERHLVHVAYAERTWEAEELYRLIFAGGDGKVTKSVLAEFVEKLVLFLKVDTSSRR